jgi:hypothetical protein
MHLLLEESNQTGWCGSQRIAGRDAASHLNTDE